MYHYKITNISTGEFYIGVRRSAVKYKKPYKGYLKITNLK